MITKEPIYSKSGTYLIVLDFECDSYYAARIFKKLRGYWVPVVWETNMSPERYKKFLNG